MTSDGRGTLAARKRHLLPNGYALVNAILQLDAGNTDIVGCLDFEGYSLGGLYHSPVFSG